MAPFKKQKKKKCLLLTSGAGGQELMEALDVDNFEFVSECVVFCKNVDVHKKWGSAYRKLNYGQNIVKTFREFKKLIDPSHEEQATPGNKNGKRQGKEKGQKDIINAF